MQINHLFYHEKVLHSVQKIENVSPLVLNLTNHVVMNLTANALLAIGSSPIMSVEQKEIEELVKICNALVINIGTLDEAFIDRAVIAAEYAKKYSKPVVLDPVGVGASEIRKQAAQKILDTGAISVVKGNASEIIALAGLTALSKGVDSAHTTDEAIAAATKLVSIYKLCVVISGATDIIVNSQYIGHIELDVPMMQKVTGMGCTAAALCGAFLGSEDDIFLAAFSTMFIMSLVGNEAKKSSKGSGSFSVNFMDMLSHITPDLVMNMSKAYVEKY